MMHNTPRGDLIFEFELPDVEIPSANVVLHEHWATRDKRIKAMRTIVEVEARRQGLGHAEPLERAQVCFILKGPYRESRDEDNFWTKDLLDALVARPEYVKIGRKRIRVAGRFRWGLITDDSRKKIGRPVIEVRQARRFSVIVGVAHAASRVTHK